MSKVNGTRQKFRHPNPSYPAVTADDNGNVLSVVGGVWDKANAPSDFVYVNVNSIGGGNYELDNGLKQSDVYTLLQSEKEVILVINVSNNIKRFMRKGTLENDGKFILFSIGYDASSFKLYKVEIENNNNTTVSFTAKTIS